MLARSLLSVLAATVGVLSAPSFMCDVSDVAINIPASLAPPIADGPRFVGVAIGVQNYSCGTTGTYTSTGAVAELFDVSCIPPFSWNSVTTAAFQAWQAAPPSVTAQDVIHTLAPLQTSIVLGQHYFITNPITGSGLSPKWDFTSASENGHPNAFVVGARTGGAPAPTNPATNVDWLSLSKVQGDLADQIYRIETRGGQPPTSCTSGSADISVKYASQYWLFGGSF